MFFLGYLLVSNQYFCEVNGTMKILSFIFISVLCFFSCQTEPKSAKNSSKSISVDYYLRSDQADDLVKAEIRLRYEADTGYVLIQQARFQGQPMRVKALGNAITWCVYEGTLDTARGFDFTFQTKDGVEGSHILPLEPVLSFQIKGGIVDKSEGFIFEWEGSKIRQNESLVLFFTDSNGKSTTMNRIMNSADSGFEVAAPLLTDIAVGKAKLYVVRKTRMKLPIEGGIKGRAELEYYTDAIEVMVRE